MKRFTFVFVTFVMGLLIVLSLQANQKESNKLLFKQTLYSQLTTDSILAVDVYANSSALFVNAAAIESLYLSSLDEHYKLIPLSYTIEKGGKYAYLGDQFTRYRYLLELPKLEMDYYIKTCYLTIILKNGTHVQADIGRLSLMKPTNQGDISVQNQYGENRHGGTYLSDITLDIFAKQPVTITAICNTIHHCVEINQSIVNLKSIQIDLGLDAFYYQSTALRIHYTLEGTLYSETVDSFRYFEILTSVIPETSYNRLYVID